MGTKDGKDEMILRFHSSCCSIYRIASHRIASYRIVSYRIMSYRIVLYRISYRMSYHKLNVTFQTASFLGSDVCIESSSDAILHWILKADTVKIDCSIAAVFIPHYLVRI